MLPTKPSSPQLQLQHSLPPPPPHHHHYHHHHQSDQHEHHHMQQQRRRPQQQQQQQQQQPLHHQHQEPSSPASRPLSPPFSATSTTVPSILSRPSLPHSPVPTPVNAPVNASTASTSPTSAFSLGSVSTSAVPPPAAPRPTGVKRPAAVDLQRSVSTAPPLKRPATTSTAPLSTAGASIKRSGSPSPAPAPSHLDHHRQFPSMATTTHAASIPVLPVPSAAMMHQPLTAEQLQGKSVEQLIHAVLQLQSQHHQYVAHISSQYQGISQQVDELRSSLHAFYSGQAACHQAAASAISLRSAFITSTLRDPFSGSRQVTALPLVPPPPPPSVTVPQQAPAPGSFHHQPSTSHSRSGSQRLPPLSPTTEAGVLQRPTAQTPATPSGPPTYEYRTVATVEEVWREYKEGIDGQPAIEELDASWGSRWRPEPRGRTWYSRRKVIWDKIKEYMNDSMEEAAAVREVERLRDGGTINKLIRLLQDERKDRGLDDSVLG